MMAMTSGRSRRAARATDWGLPPTPIQVRRRPDSVGGKTRCSRSDERVVPRQVTGPSSRSWVKRATFSSKRTS